MLQASSLALIGMLTVVGCGGSDTPSTTKRNDAGPDGSGGTTPTGVVKVDKAVLDFGSIDIGSASTAQTVNVQVTVAPVAINATVTGAGFAISGTTCAPVQAVGACTISVKFAPASIGAATGTLAIGNAAVALSGAGQNAGTFSVTDRVDLGTLLVGATSSAVVQVVPSPSVTGLTCVASGSNLTLASQTCAATGAIAAPCTFTFTFKAAIAGVKSDAVVCSAGATVKQTTVAATVVTPAALTINPPTLAFTASVGGTFVATFNVSNSGGSPTGNLSATISAGATDFAITSNDCVVPLASLAICKIQVTFKPASAGAKTGTLTVADATVGTIPATAALTGTAIPASALAITPATSDFGTVEAGATKTTNFTIKNGGGTATDAIVIGGGSAEFVVDAALCNNLPLAPGASCAFTVTFKPAAPAGAKTAAIIATENGVAKATAQVTGTAKVTGLPVLTVSPPTLDFGTIGVDTSKGPLSLTVTNSGGSATGVLSVVKKDSTSSVGGASQFAFTSPDCNGATLAPGASCTVAVTYSPTITGSASAILTISDGAVSSANGTVIGIALSIPNLTIKCPTGTTATFDSTVVGQTSANVVCTVTNDTKVNEGNQAPQESGAITATATGDFVVATNNCTASLQPKESCTLLVAFKPTAKGARAGKLSVSSANKGISIADLEGTGFLALQVDAYYASGDKLVKLAGAYDFGNVPMGSDAVTGGGVALTLAVYVHANVGNFAISGTDLYFGNANATADFTATEVTASEASPATISGIGVAKHTCKSLENTSNPPFSDSPYCFVTVNFTPKAKGAKTNAITASGANGTATDSVNMQGTGTGPLTINPTPLTFDAVAVGTSGAQVLTLTVKNSASSKGSAATIAITGTNAANFALVTDDISNKEIPAASGGVAATVPVPIRLTVPAGAAVGPLSATVTVTAVIAGVTETTTANLVGAAVTGAGISATLGGAFADTVVTGTSAPVKVSVKNNGALATDVLNVKLSGGADFSVKLAATQTSSCGDLTSNTVNNVTTYKLDPGASCDFNVWFTPTAGLGVSKRNGTLTVSSKIGGMQVLTLTGQATGLLTVTPATQDLGTTVIGTAAPAVSHFTITNNGGKQIAPSVSLFNDIGQTDATSFEIVSSTCPALLGAAGSASPLPTCVVDVRLNAPDGTLPGLKSATLKVTGTVQGTGEVGTATAVATGKAGRRATLALTPVDTTNVAVTSASTVFRDFGKVVVGATSAPQKFVVTNVGDFDSSALTFSFYDLDGSYAITNTKHVKTSDLDFAGSTCVGDGAVVKAGQSCTIQVAFHPTHCVEPFSTTCPSDVADLKVQLVITAANGTEKMTDSKLVGPKVYGQWSESNVPYVVATATGLAPYDAGAVKASTLSKLLMTIHNPSPSAAFTVPGTITLTDLNSATPPMTGTVATSGDTIALLASAPTGVDKPCTPGTTVLAAGANDYCVVEIDWTPDTDKGTREFKVAFGTASINVIGRELTAATFVALPVWPSALAASTSTSPLDFGKPVKGVDSLSKTLTIMNIGELASTDLKVVNAAGVAPAITGQVNVLDSSTCKGVGSAVASLGTCTLAMSVHPVDTQNSAVKYLALASDTNATPASLMSLGPIVAKWDPVDGANLTPSPTSLSFDVVGAVQPGTRVLAQTALTLTISNTGSAITGPLSIAMSSADFYVDPDTAASTCLGSDLALSGIGATPATATSCKLKVIFMPTSLATTAKTGTMTVSAPYATKVTIQLAGTAIPALDVTTATTTAGTFTANTGTFTDTTASASAIETFTPTPKVSDAATYVVQTFSFSVPGATLATGLLTTSISGTAAAEFKIIDDECVGVSLFDTPVAPQKALCKVKVLFAPTSAGANKEATLTVSDPLSGTPADSVSVTLKGNANP